MSLILRSHGFWKHLQWNPKSPRLLYEMQAKLELVQSESGVGPLVIETCEIESARALEA